MSDRISLTTEEVLAALAEMLSKCYPNYSSSPWLYPSLSIDSVALLTQTERFQIKVRDTYGSLPLHGIPARRDQDEVMGSVSETAALIYQLACIRARIASRPGGCRFLVPQTSPGGYLTGVMGIADCGTITAHGSTYLGSYSALEEKIPPPSDTDMNNFLLGSVLGSSASGDVEKTDAGVTNPTLALLERNTGQCPPDVESLAGINALDVVLADTAGFAEIGELSAATVLESARLYLQGNGLKTTLSLTEWSKLNGLPYLQIRLRLLPSTDEIMTAVTWVEFWQVVTLSRRQISTFALTWQSATSIFSVYRPDATSTVTGEILQHLKQFATAWRNTLQSFKDFPVASEYIQ